MKLLYDRDGDRVAFAHTELRTTIHLNDGRLLAEVSHRGVFTRDGRWLGWFVSGQVFDREGALVLAGRANCAPPSSQQSLLLDTRPTHRSTLRETMGGVPRFQGDSWAEVSGLAHFAALASAIGDVGRRSRKSDSYRMSQVLAPSQRNAG